MIILYIDDVIYEAKYEVRTDITISFYELIHTCRKMLFREKNQEEHRNRAFFLIFVLIVSVVLSPEE